MHENQPSSDVRGMEYAGAEKCRACHRDIYDNYQETAHNLTSSMASARTIKGSFSKDSNIFTFRPDLKVVMERDSAGFYQTAYLNDVIKKKVRFDIVTGSGRKGQSYLYWHDDKIYQLPISFYIPERKWVNSPNFPPKNVQFARNIPIQCFDCHSSYISKTYSEVVNNFIVDHFDKERVIYGIDCERCHGPAAAHVNFHEQNPLIKEAKNITRISAIGLHGKLNMCAMCHSGVQDVPSASFNFSPGSENIGLSNPDTVGVNPDEIDVHGKQYQMLSASKCFRLSNALTCNTCHNVHINERNNLQSFSAKCMTCHANVKHQPNQTGGLSTSSLVANCIDCHMPARPSKIITMKSDNQVQPVPALVRSHYIAIYEEMQKHRH